MKRASILAVAAAMAMGASPWLGAQTAEVKTNTTTRIELNGGKDVTVTGCMGRSADGSAFMLTNVGTTTGDLKTYHLVVADRDESKARELAKHLGQKVEIKGRATDAGEATMETSTTDVAFLGVDTVKHVATACS